MLREKNQKLLYFFPYLIYSTSEAGFILFKLKMIFQVSQTTTSIQFMTFKKMPVPKLHTFQWT